MPNAVQSKPDTQNGYPSLDTEPPSQDRQDVFRRIFKLRSLVPPPEDVTGFSAAESEREIIDSFETGKLVEQLPNLDEAAEDSTRTTRFSYYPLNRLARKEDDPGPTTELTEQEGLRRLIGFLDDSLAYYSALSEPTDEQKVLESEAATLRANLSFMGEKELQQAASGVGLVWKDYLAKNPHRQICIPVGNTRTQEAQEQRKSDSYLFERIMDTFTDDELAQYGQRIFTDPKALTSRPEDTRIILLDDWTISGIQLNRGARKLLEAVDPKYKERIEINLLAATEGQMQDESREWQGIGLPLKAYYQANEVPNNSSPPFYISVPLVTGTHSSVDFSFESTIFKIIADRDQGTNTLAAPPLTNIERKYRDSSARYTSTKKRGLRRA